LVLREYREKREAIFQDMGTSLGTDDLVFSRLDVLDANGRPSAMLPDSVTHAWIKAVRRAGLPGVRLHDARHTHVSLLIAAGVDISVIQKIEGHSSIRVTNDIYGHLQEKMKREAAQAFDKAAARPREVVYR
jgi:integrase